MSHLSVNSLVALLVIVPVVMAAVVHYVIRIANRRAKTHPRVGPPRRYRRKRRTDIEQESGTTPDTSTGTEAAPDSSTIAGTIGETTPGSITETMSGTTIGTEGRTKSDTMPRTSLRT